MIATRTLPGPGEAIESHTVFTLPRGRYVLHGLAMLLTIAGNQADHAIRGMVELQDPESETFRIAIGSDHIGSASQEVFYGFGQMVQPDLNTMHDQWPTVGGGRSYCVSYLEPFLVEYEWTVRIHLYGLKLFEPGGSGEPDIAADVWRKIIIVRETA